MTHNYRRRRIVGLLIVCFGLALLQGCERSDTSGSTRSHYEQIRTIGKLRAAYAVGAPLLVIDANSKAKSGVFYDILTGAAQKLGLGVEWTEEVGYGDMVQGLSANRYDVVGSGVWINGARGKDADFTIPAYYDAVLAFVRSGDTRFDTDLAVLNSPEFTISTMDGELGASIANIDFPKAKKTQLPQSADFSQLILNVIDRKADVVFLALAPARSYEAANPGKIESVKTASPIRVFPVAIMLPLGQFELREALNHALTEMLTDGEIETILRRYEKVPGSFARVAVPYQFSKATQ